MRAKFWVQTICACLVGACGGGGGGGMSNPDMTPPTATVSGTVADKNGLPIADVAITVYSHNTNTAVTGTTDSNGAYSISGLNTGNPATSDFSIYAGKGGFGFYPSVGDPAGSIGRYDFNGLYRTVIRFPSLPGRAVKGANFVALHAGDRVASLPRTGQVLSYAGDDDAAAKKGVAVPAVRFADNLNGTVSDRLTGLVWLKDAGCFSPANWSAALTAANALASGACGLTDGSGAGQWRMPNVNELESLVDVSRFNPAISMGNPFINIKLANAYWSSTAYMASFGSAMMAIRFSDGRWINGVDGGDGGFSNIKARSANSLWAVRSGAGGAIRLLATGVYAGQGGGSYGTGDDASRQIGVPLTSPRFVDNGDGTVADTVTGLTWLKQANCLRKPWPEALASIHSLASGQCGLTDGSTTGQWRMPNRNEMLSLSDRAPTFPQANYFNGIPGADGVVVTSPVIFKNFVVNVHYWTSTTNAADTAQAWAIYSCDFGSYNMPKADPGVYALAVR
jgi:hypothetical protein